MPGTNKTVIVTGASRGIGAAVVTDFLERGYNVVANARSFTDEEQRAKPGLELIRGDIGQKETADRLAESAIGKFGSIDHLVNNAGIFESRRFIDYSVDDFRRFISTNLEGFILITQLAVKRMLSQGTGGSVTTITAALADNPIAGAPASIPMITKGGLNAVTISLASEYARENIRFNAVAPGVVDTPLHQDGDKSLLKMLNPMGILSEAKDVALAVVYLAEARHVTGEVLHVDGGAHFGKW
jgi:NAD(P)-dependent dehydrogenase (short-subunit alcohol dehydrogenase family)